MKLVESISSQKWFWSNCFILMTVHVFNELYINLLRCTEKFYTITVHLSLWILKDYSLECPHFTDMRKHGCKWFSNLKGLRTNAMGHHPLLVVRGHHQQSSYVMPVLNLMTSNNHRGFPGSSADTECACNIGGPSLITGSGSSPGEGIGYPLQYTSASLMAQLVKNSPAMQETWFWSLA